MNHELAKTLTTALVQFIDRERPEGTMCCSNTDCASLENAFNSENFTYIEAFIRWKLSKLTEFEQCLLDYAQERDEYEYDSTNVVKLNEKVIELTKSYAKTLLSLAKKDLALTWEDIKKISRILDIMVDDDFKGEIPKEWGEEEYYEEVLRRFNKAKEK